MSKRKFQQLQEEQTQQEQQQQLQQYEQHQQQQQQQLLEIKIVSKIPDFKRTPDQVLKFIILEQQKLLQALKLENSQLKDKNSDMHNTLSNSELNYCGHCEKYTISKVGYDCNDCLESDLCRDCLDDHLCKNEYENDKLLECFRCEKSLNEENGEQQVYSCDECGNKELCQDCIEICDCCSISYCKSQCIKLHNDKKRICTVCNLSKITITCYECDIIICKSCVIDCNCNKCIEISYMGCYYCKDCSKIFHA